MYTLLLVVHLLIIVAMIGLILIQKTGSDGLSGLGGGGGGSFISGKASANFFTRGTSVLAACFMATSLALGVIAAHNKPESILDKIPASQAAPAPAAAPATPSAPVAK